MTEHFTLTEFIRSDRAKALGIDNTPPVSLYENIRSTMEGLERIRWVLGHPVILLSGYRCYELNTAVKGSRNSQHIEGQAADIICPKFGFPIEVARYLKEKASEVLYDQLIYEHGWVHVSFSNRNRLQALSFDGRKYYRGIKA